MKRSLVILVWLALATSCGPVRLAEGQVTLEGMTSDGYVVYQAASPGLSGDHFDVFAVYSGTGTRHTLAQQVRRPLVRTRGPVVLVAELADGVQISQVTVWSARTGVRLAGHELYRAEVSPDGKYLAYSTLSAGTRSLIVDSPALDAPRTLTSNACTESIDLRFTAEHLVAGYCTGESVGVVASFRLDTWEEVLLAETVAEGFFATFPDVEVNPTGSHVLLYGYGDPMSVVPIGGGPVLPVDSGVYEFEFAADGSAVVYEAGDELRLANLAAPAPTPLSTPPVRLLLGATPTLSHVLFQSYAEPYSALWLGRADGEPAVMLSPDRWTSLSPGFTRDGAYVYYDKQDEALDYNSSALYAAAFDGSGERKIAERASRVVAARGSTIVFIGDSRSESGVSLYELKAANLQTGELRTLSTELWSTSFLLSEDGAVVVYRALENMERISVLAGAVP